MAGRERLGVSDGARIRPFVPDDVAHLRRICILTGADGGDASGLYEVPELLPVIWLDPYVRFAPQLAFVAADAHGPYGYWIGVADVAEFDKWCAEHYWPRMRAQFPVEDFAPGTPDARLAQMIAGPAPARDPQVLRDYPAELHIDILPRGQGRGTGRALMNAGLDALRAAGAPGVHLGVSSTNTGAIAFYLRLGFTPLAVFPSHQVMALRL